MTTLLLDLALTHENMLAAWHHVWENDGGAGADRVTLESFGKVALAEIAKLKREVHSDHYVPGVLREIELPRPGRSARLLGIPCVRDRVLQTAVAQVIAPILDCQFADESYAYRPGRSVAGAIQQVVRAREEGMLWVVDADISDYFDSVPHCAVLERLAAALPDPSLQPLLGLWLATPISIGFTVRKRTVGLPQGAPISPVLANLYLDQFDGRIRQAGRAYVRYADDFLILCCTEDAARDALGDAERWLREDGLELNKAKTRISSFEHGFDFLGVRFQGNRQSTLVAGAGRWLLPKNLQMTPGEQAKAHFSGETHAPASPGFPVFLRTIHVVEQGAYIHRRGGRVIVSREGNEILEIPIEKLDQVSVAQEGAISFGAMREFLAKKISFVITGAGGQPVGWLDDLTGGTVALHREQFRCADDSRFCLAAATAIVGGKIANCRLLLRRYGRFRKDQESSVDTDLAHLAQRSQQATSMDVVRGLEGAAAHRYFSALGNLLGETWTFEKRNRRPPRDPVNAMLSYGYGVLFQNVLTLVVRRGLHPQVGTLHAVSERRPALIADLMEEFRPLVVDAVVLKLLLNSRIKPEHFDYSSSDYPCRLNSAGRRLFIQSLETKLDTPIQHPKTGMKIDLRRAISGQAHHWAEVVCRRAKAYRPFILR